MRAYHDEEWGRAATGERDLFERVTLEAFQSGLSWAVVLRKRERFRAVFAGFDAAVVAAFTETNVDALLGDPGIIRNRAKIEATITNARAIAQMDEPLGDVVRRFVPSAESAPPRTVADVPSQTAESRALAADLRGRGLRFVGPTTAYALMQATGIVDDHLADCHARRPLIAPIPR
jgi:DNA-3-methyladenine glycosylase I